MMWMQGADNGAKNSLGHMERRDDVCEVMGESCWGVSARPGHFSSVRKYFMFVVLPLSIDDCFSYAFYCCN